MTGQNNIRVAIDGDCCIVCGYEIVGFKVGDSCPECGSVVLQFSPGGALRSRKAKASLVLGVVSILSLPLYGIVGIVCGVLAMYFAKKARGSVQSGLAPVSSLGMATSGKICGCVGVVINSVLILFLLVILVDLYRNGIY